MSKKNKGISIKEVRHIAHLARIELTDKEVRKFQKQLENIINYFDKLNEVDTKGIEETSQVTGIVNKLRKDEVRDFLSKKHSLQNVPKRENDLVKTFTPFS